MPHNTTGGEVHELYSRILGHPQANLDKAINTFVDEFETKKTAALDTRSGETLNQLKETPTHLREAKEALDAGLESTTQKASTTARRLQLLQQAIVASSKTEKGISATQLAKEAFRKKIAEDKKAFDQDMTLRHADVVKQYVGAVVHHIDY
ncbi:MAG: hypothetical protein J3Q66DRAFT_329262 [Benniella sp.]|nr:MAG: hypothetical protein J3Q66DRAFT_329262 [Benniella sp.]